MASTIMHIAVADQLYKKINSKITINYYDYILGSIAPDISKLINAPKAISHFFDNTTEIPNLDKFLEKYKSTLDNSFNLGYFTHLYTDKLFYGEYYPLFIQDKFLTSNVRRLDGRTINISPEDREKLLYNDYSHLNHLLIDEYTLNLELFYNEFIIPQSNITEIPLDKLNLLIDNASIILQNLKTEKEYIIDISSIKAFIDNCVEELYTQILELDLI